MAEDAGGLPGVSTDGDEHIVCHVDMDCFYAACERLREPRITPMSCDYGLDTALDEGSSPRMGCASLS